MIEDTTNQAYGQKWSYVEQLSSSGDTPFLIGFAEWRDEENILRNYDERTDVWVVNHRPLATVDDIAMQTMTTTRVAGESQDTD